MTPDNDRDYYKILEKEKRLRRGNAQPQAGAGSPQFSVVTPNERGQRPAAPQSPPATQSVQVGPPSRTISQRQAVLQQTPGAGPNSIGDAQKNIRVRHRALVTQAAAAYRAGDMDTYNALVSERNNLENQSRDLSAVQPKTFVNPENAQAARERLRVQLAQELASRQTTTPPRNDAAYEAGIHGAPASVRERMNNPVDEVNRQAMIRLKAREPMVTGTGMDMEVTTPEREEVRRRAAASMAPRRDPNQQAIEALPDVTDEERSAMNSRFADARGRQEGAVPGAVAALKSVQGEREFRESIKAKNRKLAETQLDTAIASGGAVGADEQVRLLDAQTRLARAKQNAAAAGSRLDTESFQKSVDLVRDTLQPIFGSGGWFSSEMGSIGNLVGNDTLIGAAGRIESFESSVMPRLEQLAQGDPVAARELALSVLDALPPIPQGGAYNGSGGGPNGEALANRLNALRSRLQMIVNQ